MWLSVKRYLGDLGYMGLLMIVSPVLTVTGVVEIAGGEELLNVPPWVLIAIGVTLALLVPFIAYHKMWVRLESIADTRSRELARLIRSRPIEWCKSTSSC